MARVVGRLVGLVLLVSWGSSSLADPPAGWWWRYYRPGNWMPHCTLAMDVACQTTVAQALGETPLPIHATVGPLKPSSLPTMPIDEMIDQVYELPGRLHTKGRMHVGPNAGSTSQASETPLSLQSRYHGDS